MKGLFFLVHKDIVKMNMSGGLVQRRWKKGTSDLLPTPKLRLQAATHSIIAPRRKGMQFANAIKILLLDNRILLSQSVVLNNIPKN